MQAVKNKKPVFLLSTLAAVMAMPMLAQAALVEDSKASVQLRNFYMNRDFRQGDGQSKAEDWGQGFMFRLQSGFTEGTVGFGLDALGLVGIKLDSGGGTGGTGALVRSRHSGKSADSHGIFGATAKAKLSDTVLTVGTHEPLLPIAFRNDTRLLPQTFQGAQLVSKEVENLTLTAGQFRKTNLRDSTNNENMKMFVDGAKKEDLEKQSNRFNYAGASYQFMPGLTGTYFFAQMKDLYRQHHVNVQYLTDLTSDLKFKTDLRYFKSSDQGKTDVDNRLASGMFSLGYKGHWFGLGYQDASGKTGTPFIGGGTDPWTMNTLTYHHFLRAKEDSWQARYDFNFAEVGIPGLNLMARYVRGDNFKIGNNNAKEWERDIDLGYTIQSGPLKDVSLLVRNVMYRGSHTTNIDENRVIVNYTVNLW